LKKLKIIVLILFCTLFISFSLTTIYAHKGRTDSNGGHYNRSTGEYHYHHGHSAHQHPNGICPYSNNTNKDDNTTTSIPPSSKSYENNTTKDETSNKSSSKNYNEIIEKIQEEEKTNTKNNDNGFLGWLCFAIFGSITGLAIYQSQKESKK